MMSITIRVVLAALLVGALGLYGAARFAGPAREAIVIGYQTSADPGKVAQADGSYARAIARAAHRPVIWRKFDSGTDLIAALAASEVDFADLGSSPLSVAATRQLPITTVAVISQLGRSEALVVRNGAGIAGPGDLVGKRIGVPFVSTSHYSLLAALRHWRVDPARTTVLNLSPPQLAAAFARGNIDAAYVWDPALSEIKAGGTVLAGSDDVARWGSPTFNVWAVRRELVRREPAVVDAFVAVTVAAQERYRREGKGWTERSPQVKAIAAITGLAPAEVPAMLASNFYPDAAEQASSRLLGGGLAQALAQTAGFLQSQGKVDHVLVDYAPYCDPRFVAHAAGQAPIKGL